MIERSDIVLMVLNAEEGIREQDKCVWLIAPWSRSVLLSWSNKWDTVKKDTNTMRDFEAEIRDESII